jgi:hypothetical protein
MAGRIVIEASGHTLEAELSDSAAGRVISSSLPLAAEMSRWGEEYWPPGRALCIFFGRTLASTDARPRAASPVMPIGLVIA